MKKQLLSVFILLMSSMTFSQTIPNGGFESWTTTSYVQPMYYFSSNGQNNNGVINPGNVVKTTDAYHGSYAIKLNTIASGGDTVFAFFSNCNNPGASPAPGGVPYNQKPTGIRLYYKSNVIGTDSAIMFVIFKKAGANIASYFYKIGTSQSSYTLFNQTFSPVLSVIPDTVIFAAASSNAFIGNGMPGNMLQIDSISFTGVSSQPSHLNGDLELWQSLSNTTVNGWSTQNCNQTTDKYTGTYALELQTSPPSLGGGGGIQPGNAITGNYTHSGPPQGGHPYTQQIDTLFFYYKYFPADPNDSANINVTFKNSGNNFWGVYKLLPQASVYTEVKIPIDLTGSGIIPDSAILSIQSSKNWPPPNSFIGSDLKIDNMYFASQKLPVSNFILPAIGCVGVPIQLTDNSANMVTLWNWIMAGGSSVVNPTSSVLQNPVITYLTAGTHTITMNASNSFGTGSNISHTITIYAPPSVSATSPTICQGSNATVTASGATTYTWSTNATTASVSVSPINTTTYSVIGADIHGCVDTITTFVFVLSPQVPSICEVTTDSITSYKYNYIYWDKTGLNRVDSFIVYRYDVSSANYLKIGAVSNDSLSVFIDTAFSIGGPNGGNPNYAAWKYKLAIKDSCGNIGAKGPYNQSIFVQQTGANFSWTAYVDSGQVAIPSGYAFLRDDNNTGNFHALTFVSGTAASDPNYTTYPNANYRVDAQGFNCTPTYRLSGNNNTYAAKVKSHSNTNNNRVTGINQLTGGTKNQITIYPNPASSNITIGFTTATSKATIKIISILGSEIYSQTYNQVGSSISLDISKYESGAYLVQITTDSISEIKRIVKQ